MIKWMKKRMKKSDIWDIGLIKWSVAAFVLFLITIWPGFNTWVNSVNAWWFFAAFIIFIARPFYRIYLK